MGELPIAWRVSFRHLFRMTDDTGLLEHAAFLVPKRREGYTTDDNARALWLAAAWARRLPDGELKRRLLAVAETTLAFLAWAQEPDGHFHNDFHYTREKEARPPSDDTQGRALYALAYAARTLPKRAHRRVAAMLFRRALPVVETITASRGIAYALAAAAERLRALSAEARRPGAGGDGEEREALLRFLERGTRTLLERFAQESDGRWRWFEPRLTYANGILPWGLLKAARATGNREARSVAIEALDFLLGLTYYGHPPVVRPVGNRGWGSRDRIAEWDAQPLDVFKLALAADAAHASTGDGRYAEAVRAARDWFYGANALGVPMVDAEEGAAYDGLSPTGPNENAGAEALLSYLLTEERHLATLARSASAGTAAWRIRAEGDAVWIDRTLSRAAAPVR
ncbi:glycosyl transferase [Hydrogenibacillus sp. N12]|uniref:glycosyl transferase n=1 Tax=Hydrogenibacillus sp. N12 TaxID=2866627 RepID=UPI001C7DB600|nr:glycosyl transferase [Hydrogenibacillus sp. N12]QZA33877.1 glycosyl transferase [Hydrogenibacillus sp. N12]